jgi:hypothetical protein
MAETQVKCQYTLANPLIGSCPRSRTRPNPRLRESLSKSEVVRVTTLPRSTPRNRHPARGTGEPRLVVLTTTTTTPPVRGLSDRDLDRGRMDSASDGWLIWGFTWAECRDTKRIDYTVHFLGSWYSRSQTLLGSKPPPEVHIPTDAL